MYERWLRYGGGALRKKERKNPMSKSSTKATVSEAVAPAVAPKRTSRLPIASVQEALTGNQMLVKDVAEKLKITERDVRLSIDTLRRKYGPNAVVRSALKTFTMGKLTAAK